MSETKTTKKQLPAYLILALIALVAALALAVTNAITAAPIKAHQEAAQNAAFQSVMDADTFVTLDVPEGSNVTALVEGQKDGQTVGYCAVAASKGYGGDVAVTLGVDMNGKIVGCQIGDTNFAETAGFGAKWQESARAEAFKGLDAFGGGTIEAITGATITSNAVLAASNDVLSCIAQVMGKELEGDALSFGVKEETPTEPVKLEGDVHQGTAAGFGGADVVVRLTLNEDGTVAALAVDASTQTPGIGTRCADEEFTAQFIGKTGPFTVGENVDALTGATVTSNAAVEAINAALAAPAMAAEDLEALEAQAEPTEEPVATETPVVEIPENAKTATIAAFGGAEITVNVADEDGVVTYLSVEASSQTAGFGQKCAEEAFTSQFIGKTAPFALGDGIDGVTSATITSQAVVDALNSLYGVEAQAESTEEPVATEEPVVTEAPVVEIPENAKTATIAAFGGAEITVNVADEDGVVTYLSVEASSQTAGFGQKCAEEAFTSQFIGKTAPFALGDGIDGVTSATITSQAVVDALNSLYVVEQPTEEPTAEPTEVPTEEPTAEPTEEPTAEPTEVPTEEPTAEPTEAPTEEPTAEPTEAPTEEPTAVPVALTVDPNAQEKVVEVWGGTTMTVWVLADEDGTVQNVWVDASQQSAEYGQKCADEAFTSQFIGKKAPFAFGENGVDAVSGATTSSELVLNAINEMVAPAEEEAPVQIPDDAKMSTIAAYDGAAITVFVADDNGMITFLSVDASSQTVGLGQKCADEAFTSQFIGQSAPFTLGEGIDAVSSATITSQAVVDAVNSLYVSEPVTLPEESEENPVVDAEPETDPVAEATEEPVSEPVEVSEDVTLTATVKGWHDGVVVTVTTDSEGVIKALAVDASGEFRALGALCGDEAFTSQFVGKTAPLTLGEDIDAVTGATLTSQAVVDALNELLSK